MRINQLYTKAMMIAKAESQERNVLERVHSVLGSRAEQIGADRETGSSRGDLPRHDVLAAPIL